MCAISASAGASDDEIWDFAKTDGFAVVSKDSDFRERSYVKGFPPKVIWLEVGNAGTDVIVALLQTHRAAVEDFLASGESSILILSETGSVV